MADDEVIQFDARTWVCLTALLALMELACAKRKCGDKPKDDTGESEEEDRVMQLFPFANSFLISVICLNMMIGTPAEMYTAGILYCVCLIRMICAIILAKLGFVPQMYRRRDTSSFEMSQLPDYTTMSEAVSEVLAEIGLNDTIRNKKKRKFFVMEAMQNVFCKMIGITITQYVFSSQIEGTTTRGLNSDFDCLYVNEGNVLSEPKDWKPGECNMLMVEGEGTPPGYCKLQLLSPVPEHVIFKLKRVRDRQGRVLLENTLPMNDIIQENLERHGPAWSHRAGNATLASDIVQAFKCTSQPSVVLQWLRQLHGRWPSEDLKKTIASMPCFVVPVGSRGSAYEILEWRISTSLAERCLIFNLNVTQLQVYTLMKMLLKTCINYNVPEESQISSFMCKTVVLHCVQNKDSNDWKSYTLINCLLFSLSKLYSCVASTSCPHFIIRSNNLMAGRFKEKARHRLQQNLKRLLDDIISCGILSLRTDDIASRLESKLNPALFGSSYLARYEECQAIYCDLIRGLSRAAQSNVRMLLISLTANRPSGPITLLQQYVQYLDRVYIDGNTNERSACRLLRPYVYTTLGSLIASESIPTSGVILPEARDFFNKGLTSDMASGRLKMASAFFCAGDVEKAEQQLRDLEGRYGKRACTPVCVCNAFNLGKVVMDFSLASVESDITKNTSSCVIFTQSEKNCIPQELHYEMYRSTRDDRQYRHIFDYWMDWAVVDCLPFLHFLLYKVYGRLERRTDQQTALDKLKMEILKEPKLGHRETALNLLGRCMEQEDRWNDALWYYSRSLIIRPRNNAANFHVCRLLYMRYRQCHA